MRRNQPDRPKSRNRPRINAPQDSRSAAATRARILDAAEALFLEHGFDGTSLRLLSGRAGVNLAAVNYHFGGKDELFRTMLALRLDALNEQRIALLDQREGAAPEGPDCESILGALLLPVLAIARRDRIEKRHGADLLRLLGRAYVDPSPLLRQFLSERYAPVVTRFKEAFARALPELSRQELSWRLHFMLGALSYTLAGTNAWKLIETLNPLDSGNDETLLRRLTPFLLAGLRAPLPELVSPAPVGDDPVLDELNAPRLRVVARGS
jgi:AcrR family transcriptional regulator